MGSRIIFSIARGPRHVLITSATVCAIAQLPASSQRVRTYLCSHDIRGLSLAARLTFRSSVCNPVSVCFPPPRPTHS
jgi:hypothetical protein